MDSIKKKYFQLPFFFLPHTIDGSLAESGRLFKKSGVCQTLPDFFFSPDLGRYIKHFGGHCPTPPP